jgi:hypothetical protein
MNFSEDNLVRFDLPVVSSPQAGCRDHGVLAEI